MRCWDVEHWMDAALSDLQHKNRLRSLTPLDQLSAVHVRLGDRRLILFSSNDYLGLSFHPEVRSSISEMALRHGNGPRGSPLICGTTDLHQQLSSQLAALANKSEAVLFSSGYAANLGVITALCDRGTEIYSDQLNHASIIDACRMARQAGSRLQVYRHNDANHLEQLLHASHARRRLILTESVFSTQGDIAPLTDLVELRRRYAAQLVIDEGHAMLVFGSGGGGLAEQLGIADQVDVQVGTLSKAAAGLGGFAACGKKLAQLIMNRARSFMFSTASPLPLIAGLLAALRVSRTQPSLRHKLWGHVHLCSRQLQVDLTSPIFSIVLGSEERTLQASQELIRRGFHVIGIRPPTVPEDTCRLRITLSAAHSEKDLEHLMDQLVEMELAERRHPKHENTPSGTQKSLKLGQAPV